MKFRPMNDRILVKRIEAETRTAGGLIIPDSAKEKPLEGEVIATGPGRLGENGERRAMTVKVGDRILFARYSENEIKLDGVNYLIVREDDILAVVER
jgi:chaperonin GroES